jgi:hypothetical protein
MAGVVVCAATEAKGHASHANRPHKPKRKEKHYKYICNQLVFDSCLVNVCCGSIRSWMGEVGDLSKER